MRLSKSRYCAGLQCPKILWMDRNMPEQKAGQNDSHLIIGNIVGNLAKGYFGQYAEVHFDRNNMGGMIEETELLLNEGTGVITEASFLYDGCFCSVDILRKVGGGYEIIEVKSASGKDDDRETDLSQVYLDDIAYQYYVLTHCGLKIAKTFLMCLNKEYVRHGELDVKQLFALTDCTARVLSSQDEIPRNISAMKTVAAMESEPEEIIGNRCDTPYECGYKGWCFRSLPEHNVFEIGWRMKREQKDALYHDGIVSFEDIIRSGCALSEKPLRQVMTTLRNLPPHIDKESLRRFLATVKYPLYHLDFETYQQPVPEWDGVSPYKQIVFQYSLHIQSECCGAVEHREFLGKHGIDPRRELAEHLCADIPPDVCVMVYNKSFERTQLENLAALFPEMEAHLMSIRENIVDLMLPFSSGMYYCREMGRGYSIKNVLPALCGDDPELDYQKLPLIHNGGEAMTAYATLHEQPPEEAAKIRAALLAYCKLDTLAMVKVLEKLYEAAE